MALARGDAVLFLLLFDEGDEVGDSLFHHARGFHDLGKEHLAGAEQVADDVHAVHQRALDDLDRTGRSQARFLGVFEDVGVDPLHQRVGQPLGDRQRAPFRELLLLGGVGALEALGKRDQPFRRLFVAVEDHVLDGFAKLGIDSVVDVELTGVDDAHVHACGNGVVEENAVHRATNGLVTAEREAEVRQAARDVHAWTAAADLAGGLDEVEGIAAMLVDSSRDREDVGVEDDVLRLEPVRSQQLVRPLADGDLARGGVGLSDLVEGHDHDRCAIGAALAGELEEGAFAFLEADRIDDRLARDALEPGFDHAPLGAVDHHGNAGDIRLGRDALEENSHCLL